MVGRSNTYPQLRALLPQLKRRAGSHGTRPDSDFRILPLQQSGSSPAVPGSRFQAVYRGQELGDYHLNVPGAHDVLNATAAAAGGAGRDINVNEVQSVLVNFRAAGRSFQVRGQAA